MPKGKNILSVQNCSSSGLLLLLSLLLATPARSSCAHTQQHLDRTTLRIPLGFHPSVLLRLPGGRALRSSTPTGTRPDALSRRRQRHSNNSGIIMVLPQRQQGRQASGLFRNRRFDSSSKPACLCAGGRSSTAVGADSTAAAASDGSRSGATRLQAFEAVVQKW